MSAVDGKVFGSDEMTSRQRLLAAYRGEPTDRLPLGAKVTNPTWRTSQPEGVRDLSDVELLDAIGADGIFGASCDVRIDQPHVEIERRRSADGQRVTTILHTPDGDLSETRAVDPYTESWHPVEHPIKTREDILRFRWFHTDVSAEPDDEQIADSRRQRDEIGERGIRVGWWGQSPWMHAVEHLIGPADSPLMLYDYPDEVDELMALMHESTVKVVRQIARCTVADAIVSGENTSTTLISPQQFERYCRGHLSDYGRAIAAEGKLHELHMCGRIRDLLGSIDTIPAASIEAFTSPSLGDTRLVDGRTLAPSKTLIGGTNVNVWLRPVDEIVEYVLGELDACGDRRRIVLTTAGVAPPGCGMETFRAVFERLAEDVAV